MSFRRVAVATGRKNTKNHHEAKASTKHATGLPNSRT
jgi:hypothetical protein